MSESASSSGEASRLVPGFTGDRRCQSAEVVEVEVKDAATALMTGFLGSPTVRIDGRDVEPAARSAQEFGLTCRTYIDDGYRAGAPPIEWIRTAIREARGQV